MGDRRLALVGVALGKFPFGNWTFSFGITPYYSGSGMNF